MPEFVKNTQPHCRRKGAGISRSAAKPQAPRRARNPASLRFAATIDTPAFHRYPT